MPTFDIYPETKFFGALVDQRGKQLDVEFFALIDRAGELHVRIEPVVEQGATVEFVHNNFARAGQTLNLQLTGTTSSGRFASTGFYLTGKRTCGAFTKPMLTLAGRCGFATITRQSDSASPRPAAVAFYTNGFKTFIDLKAESEYESVMMFGHVLWDKQEPPIAGKVVLTDKSGVPSENWFDEAAASLRHIARMMSLATDVYIEPRVVHEQRRDADVFSVDGTVPSPQPHIAPFEIEHLDVVFKHTVAMTKDDRKTFEEFDLPIRWLIAPAHYDEARHIGAMTALEAILSNASLKENLLEKTMFEHLRKKLSKVIKEEGLHPDVVKSMCGKLLDLNRPALRDALEIYLEKHDVPTEDFPPEVFESVIAARNQVVHDGIGRKKHADIVPFMYVARALVTRMILRAAKYHGPLRWANDEGFKQVNL